jgi:DNA helicase-2/ATP-dependent DNA helicase PcrA
LHSAKGLEWDAVFLVGVSEGLMPISMADGPDAVEEERRLLYVGITRAREHLHVSWARARTPGGRASRKPSRFLDGLRPGESQAGPRAASRERARGGRRSATPAKCRSCGSLLSSGAERKVGRCDDCPPTYDEGTFERLRAWRLAVSTAAAVPAYVVFTDATLVALAEQQPDDVAGLARIPGIGATKRDRYGEQVLAILGGAAVEDVVRAGSDADDQPAADDLPAGDDQPAGDDEPAGDVADLDGSALDGSALDVSDDSPSRTPA